MKYIISENRLFDIFKKFMDSRYSMGYKDMRTKADSNISDYGNMINNNTGEVFGYIINSHFFYTPNAVNSNQDTLSSMFGEQLDELLYNYLTDRFPELEISGVE